MARTVTLSDIELQSIVINNIPEQPGYQCMVSYKVVDGDGNPAVFGESTKHTADADYEPKLSGASNTLVTDFITAMLANMNAKEEL